MELVLEWRLTGGEGSLREGYFRKRQRLKWRSRLGTGVLLGRQGAVCLEMSE